MLCSIVRLDEELDVAREREHRPGALAKHDARHLVRIRDHRVTVRHVCSHHLLQAPKQFLVLEFFSREADEPLERVLVAQDVTSRLVQHLCADEALDESENIGVGAALDLTEQAGILGRQKIEAIDE